MIYDSLKNHALYEYNDKYKKAFEYLLNYTGQEPGRYEIGSGVVALVQDRNTEPLEKRRFENHARYIDIQYILEGREEQGVTLCDDFEVSVPYNEETDVAFYKGAGTEVGYLTMKPGYFTLYYPHDYHMPIIGDGGRVKKIVMKVPFED